MFVRSFGHTLAGFVVGGLFVAAVNLATAPDAGDTLGTYDVPGGFLTVHGDTSATYIPENNGDR